MVIEWVSETPINRYRYIGELTDKDVNYLNNLRSDSQRKRALFNWYGKHGTKYAWIVYQNWENEKW
jgi:hypothetical protein